MRSPEMNQSLIAEVTIKEVRSDNQGSKGTGVSVGIKSNGLNGQWKKCHNMYLTWRKVSLFPWKVSLNLVVHYLSDETWLMSSWDKEEGNYLVFLIYWRRQVRFRDLISRNEAILANKRADYQIPFSYAAMLKRNLFPQRANSWHAGKAPHPSSWWQKLLLKK